MREGLRIDNPIINQQILSAFDKALDDFIRYSRFILAWVIASKRSKQEVVLNGMVRVCVKFQVSGILGSGSPFIPLNTCFATKSVKGTIF